MLKHIAAFIPDTKINEVIGWAGKKSTDDMRSGFSFFSAIRQGIDQRGAEYNDRLVQWGIQLAHGFLNEYYPSGSAVKPGTGSEEVSPEVIAYQKLALEIAGNYNLTSLEPNIGTAIQQEATDPGVKVAAARALFQIAPEENAKLLEKILRNESEPLELRKRIIGVLGEFPGLASRSVLERIKNIPPALQDEIAVALAGSPEGKEIIFEKVRNGEIFPRTLIEPRVEERILLNISDAQKSRYKKLTLNLAPINEEKEKLIKERLANFVRSESSITPGRAVFVQRCSVCHQVDNEGGLIGPQLTGIGNWGAEALAEKILDPNRNISEAFRNYTIELKSGKVMTGLYRREEGEMVIFADASGKEFSVPKKDIAEQLPSRYTLMPDNFGNVLSQEEFNALLSYLLSLK